jgi:hypothetical protein
VVRILALVVGGAIAALPAVAHADQRADLQAKGEQLAKDGRYADAIEQFKAAEKLEHRATHACLIALAYTRRELWSQADLWLTRCHQPAPGETMPDWTRVANDQILARLTQANLADVTLVVEPATATDVQLTLSGFAPDEQFEPHTIRVPLGTTVIFARAKGYADAQQVIQVQDRSPKRIVITLRPERAAPVETAKPAPPATTPPGTTQPATTLPPRQVTPPLRDLPYNPAGVAFIEGGVTAIALGAVAHVWMAYERGKLVDANRVDDRAAYDAHSTRFDVARIAAIGLYATGAALVITGVVKRTSHHAEAGTTVSALPLAGGAFVSIGWQR